MSEPGEDAEISGALIERMSIEWYEWCRESFEQAEEEDRPIFLFLGAYWDPGTKAALEKVFSRPAIATLLEHDYLPIQVDLDQRPDIYDRYSTEGWPCMAILTPKGSPIWVSNTFGDAELEKMLSQLKQAYQASREVVDQEIRDRDAKNAVERQKVYHMTCKVDDEIFRKTVQGIMISFDMDYMGFGGAPKYPHPSSLRVLAQAFSCVGGEDLKENLAGGLRPLESLFDSQEGGFYRFARRKDWSQVLTAKMCEENGELIRVFLDGSKLLEEPLFHQFASQTAAWAHSTLWDGTVARFFGSQAAREIGTPPPVDPVYFTSGSAVMASAFLQASVDLDQPEYEKIALHCIDGLWAEGFDPERGMCSVFSSGPRYFGQARSQASMLGALLDAYEFTGKKVYLERADYLLSFCRERLWSEEDKGFLDRLPGEEVLGELKEPRKNLHENALLADVAIRFAHLTGKGDFDFPSSVLAAFPNFQDEYGHHTSHYAVAADRLLRPATEIDLYDAPEEWRKATLSSFLLRRVVRHHQEGGDPRARIRIGDDFEEEFSSVQALSSGLGDL